MVNEVKRVSCAIISNKEGNVLLQLRSYEPKKGSWVLFGGHIESGESPNEACIREIKEELDYKVKSLRFFGDYFNNNYKQIIFIVMETVDLKNLNLLEGADMKFFSRDEIKELDIAFDQKRVVEDFFSSPVSRK